MKNKFLCKVCKTPSLILFLFLTSIIFANDNIEGLYKKASLWQVGENKAIVQKARDELVKLDKPALKWIYENKLKGHVSSLDMRAITYIFKNAPSSTVFILEKFKSEKSIEKLKYLIYIAGIIKDKKLIPIIEGAHNNKELLLGAIVAYSNYGKIFSIKSFKKAYKKANTGQKIKLISIIGKTKYKKLYPFLEKIKKTTKNSLIYFAVKKSENTN